MRSQQRGEILTFKLQNTYFYVYICFQILFLQLHCQLDLGTNAVVCGPFLSVPRCSVAVLAPFALDLVQFF